MTRKFNSVKKDRLFYDRFEYCLGFYLEEASCLRTKDHEQIDSVVKRRQQWLEMAQQRWIAGSKVNALLRPRVRDITEKTITDLHTVADVFLKTSSVYKLVVSMNNGYVYTNDLDLIEQLSVMPELAFKTYTRAQVARAKNTVQLQNPRHEFRSYFRNTKLTHEQKEHLMDFLRGQQGHVRLSPALNRWLDQPFNYVQDYFFVDHDSQTWLTMLSLVSPGLIRKTMHIIPAK